MDVYPSLAIILFVITEPNTIDILQYFFRLMASSIAFQCSIFNALNIRYLVFTFFHCFQ